MAGQRSMRDRAAMIRTRVVALVPWRRRRAAPAAAAVSGTRGKSSQRVARVLWIKGKQDIAYANAGTFKVPLSNKAGAPLTGAAATVGLELHAGLATALGMHPNSDPAAPGGSVRALDAGLFERLRAACGVGERSFRASVCLQDGRTASNMTFIGNAEAAGKSGKPHPIQPRRRSGSVLPRAAAAMRAPLRLSPLILLDPVPFYQLTLVGSWRNCPRSHAKPSSSDRLSSRLDGLSSRLDCLSSRLDRLSSRLDRLSSRLDCLSSRLDCLSSRLDWLLCGRRYVLPLSGPVLRLQDGETVGGAVHEDK